jgi:uncharacterized protein (TIGR02145 family)
MKKIFCLLFLVLLFACGDDESTVDAVDTDVDGVMDDIDNCIDTFNSNQEDADNDGVGDACQDTDGDGVMDDIDNCIDTANPNQEDADNNGIGDACEENQEVTSVTNPVTGRVWMDRNLGASQVATSTTDAASYGDLYQWGRAADGHQIRTSGTTTTLSTTDTPGHGGFILSSGSRNFDWRSPQNDNLWQGVNGINNPCPSGYRLPTEAEWVAEIVTWSSNNSAGAFASALKLPVAGGRSLSNGSIGGVGSGGYYWSSSLDGAGSQYVYSQYVYFNSSNTYKYSYYRSYGFSVRCIKG